MKSTLNKPVDIKFLQYLTYWICTAAFAYLIIASLLVMVFNGYTSRISLMGFLIPHASKIALWSAVSLLYLRPRFGWQFPFATILLYCMAELITNWIYVPVHLLITPSFPAEFFNWRTNQLFIFSNVFFILAITLSWIVMKGNFYFTRARSMLPFALLIGVWVSAGYVTDSTMLYAAPGVELAEFVWSVLYLYMMVNGVFHAKRFSNLATVEPRPIPS